MDEVIEDAASMNMRDAARVRQILHEQHVGKVGDLIADIIEKVEHDEDAKAAYLTLRDSD